MIELTATNVVVVITATETANNITVSTDDILFTVTDVNNTFSITNVVNDITFFSDGIGGFDFAAQHKGDWVNGAEYLRNDVVHYEESIYISSIPFRTVYTSTIAPPQDTTKWELFYFQESTMRYLTVTNTATIGGPVAIGSNTVIGGTLSVSGVTSLGSQLFVGEELSVSGDVQFGQGLRVQGRTTSSQIITSLGGFTNTGEIYSSGAITSAEGTSTFRQISTRRLVGPLTVTDDTTITGYLEVYGPLYTSGSANIAGAQLDANQINAADRVISSAGTSSFVNVNVQNQFKIGNQFYPTNAGTNGQVLATNGTSSAYWSSLGDLRVWELGSDLLTKGYFIETGAGAAIGLPNPELKIGSGTRAAGYKTHIHIKEVPVAASKGEIEIKASQVDITDSVDIGGNLYLVGELEMYGEARFQDDIRINGAKNIIGGDGTSFVRVTPGIRFPDGTTMSTAAVGTGTGTITLPIASTSTLGGIRVGEYLTINPSTGVLSVNTLTLGQASYTLPIATASTLGGIRVGQFLSIETATGILSVNTVSIGQASYTLPIASASVLGGIKVGNNLSINPSTGVLDASSSTTGIVDLETDMNTNGFFIRRSATFPDALLDLEPNNTRLASNASTDIVLGSDTITLDADQFVITDSEYFRVGNIITKSRLLVSNIYSYAGVGAPQFPYGIQFADGTVQLTAYYSNDFGPLLANSLYGLEQQARVVDFNNATLNVDFNLS